MTLSAETLLVVSLMMAVFAAVSTVGSSLFLGAGFERLRAGFETIKKQTAFFSEQIHKLDTRVDGVEKQGRYFFEAITNLEQQSAAPVVASDDMRQGEGDADTAAPEPQHNLIVARGGDAVSLDLLTAAGFICEASDISVGADMSGRAGQESLAGLPSLHFH